jgi:hypothetical protein
VTTLGVKLLEPFVLDGYLQVVDEGLLETFFVADDAKKTEPQDLESLVYIAEVSKDIVVEFPVVNLLKLKSTMVGLWRMMVN